MGRADLQEGLERWLPVPEYEGLYSASSFGRIRSEDRCLQTKIGLRSLKGRVLSSRPMADGYPAVTLCKGDEQVKRRVHVWIALTFHGARPLGTEIRHKDGDKLNNREDNLVYGTSQDNSDDCEAHGRFHRGLKHQNAVLSAEQIEEILALPAGTRGNNVIEKWALRNGVSKGHVYNIRAGYRRSRGL